MKKEKEKLLISACLFGERCRYDGKSNALDSQLLSALSERYTLVSVCPEIIGGLPTPRIPSERVGEMVVMKNGNDVTENFRRGAAIVCDIAKENGITVALMKERSPSCGFGKIYDGSFTGTLKIGSGVCAEALMKEGVAVFVESDIEKLLKRD